MAGSLSALALIGCRLLGSGADWLEAARLWGSSATGSKMAAAVVAVCGLLAVLAAGAEGGPRTLVLLENGNLRDTHSMFFRSLAGTERTAAGSREGLDGAGGAGLWTQGQDGGGGWGYLRAKGMFGIFGSGRGRRLESPGWAEGAARGPLLEGAVSEWGRGEGPLGERRVLGFTVQDEGGDLGCCRGRKLEFPGGRGGVWGSHVRVEEEIGVPCQAEEADRGPLRENGGFEVTWSVCVR